MDRKTLIGFGGVFLTGCFFGSMELSISMLYVALEPIQVNFERFLVGGIFLIPFAAAHLKKRGLGFSSIPKKDWAYFALLGFINIVVSMSLFQIAIALEYPAVIAIIMSTTPVFTTLLATPIAHEQVKARNVASVTLGLIAIVAIVAPDLGKGNPLGLILAIAAAVTFALYGVMNKAPIRTYGGMATTCIAFVIGAAELGIVLAIGYIPPIASWLEGAGLGVFATVPVFQGHTLEMLPMVAYVYLGVTALGYVAWFKAIDLIGAQSASMVFFIKPVVACILAYAVIAEPITWNMQLGVALLLVGSLASFLPDKDKIGKGKRKTR